MGQNLLKCLENGPALRSLMYRATFGAAPSDARESNFGGEEGLTHSLGSSWTPHHFLTTAAPFWGVV